jgi:HptB-dependent secretion and biofilm anti anti-sigma factor
MSSLIDTLLEDKALTIKIQGSFDFNCLQDFKSAYQDVSPKPDMFIIDLERCTYLDSSALGMIVALWDYSGRDKNKIKMINVHCHSIRALLHLARLEDIIQIE